jgi:hypothetical protein
MTVSAPSPAALIAVNKRRYDASVLCTRSVSLVSDSGSTADAQEDIRKPPPLNHLLRVA